MSLIIFLGAATAFLAYANGANDNFKGVATLFGSDTVNYRLALALATVTTFAGSMCALLLAGKLLESFSGNGLVPAGIAASPPFLLAVALGAATTVILATFFGFPISTTHSLLGALIGAGLMNGLSSVNLRALSASYVIPLLVSPLISVVLAGVLYPLFRALRLRLGIEKETCVCVGSARLQPAAQPIAPLSIQRGTLPLAEIRTVGVIVDYQCKEKYHGKLFGVSAQTLLNIAHYISAGVVSFARGLNDTPKIAAILLSTRAFNIAYGMAMVGVAIAFGGLLSARKVAATMSKKITGMNHGQGFSANLVTGLLVLFASRLGVPVSTTHVAVGSLFGISLHTGRANTRIISRIILSWILTLPVAMLMSGLIHALLIG